MSRFPAPRQFDPRMPLEVRHGFRFAGRDYTAGEPFVWRDKGLSMRRVRQLFDAGKLRNASATPEPVADVFPETPEPAETPVAVAPELVFSDGLGDIYSLKDLREIAEMEGAPIKRSIKEQRDAIRENRADG